MGKIRNRQRSIPIWSEDKNGFIRFTVNSPGITGAEWTVRLKEEKCIIDAYAQDILDSNSFMVSQKSLIHAVLIRGSYFKGRYNMDDVEKVAKEYGFTAPNADVGCMARERFLNAEIEKMGISWMVIAHKPVIDRDNDLIYLAVAAKTVYLCLQINLQIWLGDYSGVGYVFIDKK